MSREHWLAACLDHAQATNAMLSAELAATRSSVGPACVDAVQRAIHEHLARAASDISSALTSASDRDRADRDRSADELARAIAERDASARSADETVKRLNAELTKRQTACDALRAEHDRMRLETETLRVALKNARADADNARADADNARRDATRAYDEVREAVARVRSVTALEERLEVELRDVMRVVYTPSTAPSQELKTETAKDRRRVSALERECARLTAELDDARAGFEVASGHAKGLQAALTSLRQSRSDLHLLLTAAQKRYAMQAESIIEMVCKKQGVIGTCVYVLSKLCQTHPDAEPEVTRAVHHILNSKKAIIERIVSSDEDVDSLLGAFNDLLPVFRSAFDTDAVLGARIADVRRAVREKRSLSTIERIAAQCEEEYASIRGSIEFIAPRWRESMSSWAPA